MNRAAFAILLVMVLAGAARTLLVRLGVGAAADALALGVAALGLRAIARAQGRSFARGGIRRTENPLRLKA